MCLDYTTMTSDFLFTSESVTEGHPDKVCDQISDAILDACLEQDPLSRVAVEALAKDSTVVLAGEISSRAEVDYHAVVRQVVREIGYSDPDEAFHPDGLHIIELLTAQAEEISYAVFCLPKRSRQDDPAVDSGPSVPGEQPSR